MSQKPIMTITDLKRLVDLAFERGIHPMTAVVVATDGWYDELEVDVCDPSAPENQNEEGYIWFTLNPAGEADARFTPAHELDYE